MTYTFKLSRRLAVARLVPIAALVFGTACDVVDPVAAADAGAGELALSPARATAEPRQPIKLAFRDQVDGKTTPSFDVEWTVVGGSGTIAPDGSFTAVEPGVYTIIGSKGKGSGNSNPSGNNGQGQGNGGPRNQTDTSTVVVVPPPPALTAVELTPASVSLQAGEHLQFDAVGRDANGATVAIGVEWSATGGTIDAGGHFIAGSAGGDFRVVAKHGGTGYADTAVVEVVPIAASPATPSPAPPPPSGDREEADFQVILDRSFETISDDSWGPQTPSSNFSIVTSGYSGAAPSGEPSVGRIRFPAGFEDGSSPAYTIAGGFEPKKTLYVSMWVQVSPNWYGHAVNSKIGYVWTGDRPKVYFNLMGAAHEPLTFRVKLQNMNAPAAVGATSNNLANPVLDRGRWHKIEMRMTVNTFDQPDGTLEAWVNGEKVLEAGGLNFNGGQEWATSESRNNWHQFEWRPIWGGTSEKTPSVPEDQYMFMDHLYASGR